MCFTLSSGRVKPLADGFNILLTLKPLEMLGNGERLKFYNIYYDKLIVIYLTRNSNQDVVIKHNIFS
ncbi:hypothetical protein BC440_08055 [Thalassospira sp. MIT1004]|nr:hypothetical protein BC440_08055 [Thalassospira sp. MIT1004]